MRHCTGRSKVVKSNWIVRQGVWQRWMWIGAIGLTLMALRAWVVYGPTVSAAEAATQPAADTKSAATPGAPVIHVDNHEYDFGDKWVGPPIDFSFTIHNKGSSSLKITGVYPGCGGCTTVGEYPKEIEAGQSGKFPFILKTESLRGTVIKTITIASNDPTTPSLALRLRGNFRKRIEVVPSAAFFGPIIGNQPATRLIKIKNNTDKALELKLNPIKSDRFKFDLIETEPGQTYDLRITTLLPHRPGEATATAELISNIPEEKTVQVTATGRIPDRLDLFPSSVSYHKPQQLPPGRDSVFLSFWLNNYGASLIDVKEAVVNDPAIKTVVDTRAPGKNYRIEVSIPVHVGIPPEGRVLTIRTNDPDKPVLTAKIMPQAQQPSPTTHAPEDMASRPTPPPPAETLLGKAVPTFKLKTIDGQEVSSDLKGKVTVLNFVSPLCPWCRKQIPEVEKIRAQYQSKGVRFVNVVNPNPTMQRVYTDAELAGAFGEMGSKLEVAPDVESKVGLLFSARSYPTLFVVDKEGKIASVDIGFNKVGLLQSQIEAALAGKPVPTGTQPTN